MSKIRIVTDSSITIEPELVEKYNITVVPLSVMVDGVIYSDSDLREEGRFLDMMKHSKELPKTSQPPVGLFAETYENRLSKSPAAFDQKKLDWMSNDYIKNADFDKVFALCKPFLEEAGRLTDKAEKLVELYKPQMTAAEEIVPLTDLFFEDFPELTEAEKEVMAGETVPTVLKAFKAKLEAMSDDEFVVENIFPQIKAVQKETGIKGKNLFMPIRIAVSGEMHGPELPDTIFLLGREKSIKHIDQVLATL